MAYESQTDKKLKQIAIDLYDGKIFCDRHEEGIDSFTILKLADKKMLKSMMDDKIQFIYEYMDKAGPLSVNGRPMFMSFGSLNDVDTKNMLNFYEEYKKIKEKFQEEKPQ